LPFTGGIPWADNASVHLPCSDVQQVIDPVFGNLALRLTIPAGTLSYNPGSQNTINLVTTNLGDTGETVPGTQNFPDGIYAEITFRTDTPSDLAAGFWEITRPPMGLGPGACGHMEFDFLQTVQGPSFINPAWNWYTCDGQHLFAGLFNEPPAYSQALNAGQYVTIAGMITNDNGSGHWTDCAYFDGTRWACSGVQPYDNGGPADQNRYQERNCLINSFGSNSCQNSTSPCTLGAGEHIYIKSIRILSCPGWLSTNRQVAACGRSTFNGNFYQ